MRQSRTLRQSGSGVEPADVASVGEVDENGIGSHVPVRFTDESIGDAIGTYEEIGGDETGEDVQLTVTIESHKDISPELASVIHGGI